MTKGRKSTGTKRPVSLIQEKTDFEILKQQLQLMVEKAVTTVEEQHQLQIKQLQLEIQELKKSQQYIKCQYPVKANSPLIGQSIFSIVI